MRKRVLFRNNKNKYYKIYSTNASSGTVWGGITFYGSVQNWKLIRQNDEQLLGEDNDPRNFNLASLNPNGDEVEYHLNTNKVYDLVTDYYSEDHAKYFGELDFSNINLNANTRFYDVSDIFDYDVVAALPNMNLEIKRWSVPSLKVSDFLNKFKGSYLKNNGENNATNITINSNNITEIEGSSFIGANNFLNCPNLTTINLYRNITSGYPTTFSIDNCPLISYVKFTHFYENLAPDINIDATLNELNSYNTSNGTFWVSANCVRTTASDQAVSDMTARGWSFQWTN